MALQSIAYLKSKFQTGDIPTEQDFIDLVDSYLHYTRILQTTGSSDEDLMSQEAITNALALKLDVSAYNDRYKGKYTSLVNLEAAHPTASPGDYAQVDAGGGDDVVNYNWDDEEGWIEGGSGSAATDTDMLPEGSTNLYFTEGRVRATVLTGLSLLTGGTIASTDSILVALGKLQNQIDLKAPLASPALTGTPTAPTAADSTNTTQIATTAFVLAQRLVAAFVNWIWDFVAEAGTSHTFVLGDAGKSIRCSSSSTVTLTIPNNSSVAYAVGTRMRFKKTGSGLVVIAPDSGVTIQTEDPTNLTIRKQYGFVDAVKTDTNTWEIVHSPSSLWEWLKTQTATITAQWIFQGTDDSGVTASVIIRNLSGNTILKTYNDQRVEFGGNSSYLKVLAGTSSGNAKIEFLDNLALGYIMGTAGQNFIEFVSTTGDQKVRVKVGLEQDSNGAQYYQVHLLATTSTTASAVTTIGSVAIVAGTIVNIWSSWLVSEAGGITGGGMVEHTLKNLSGTTSEIGSANAPTPRRSAGDFTFDINADNTNDVIDFDFTNSTATNNKAYTVSIHAEIHVTALSV